MNDCKKNDLLGKIHAILHMNEEGLGRIDQYLLYNI